MEVNVSLYEDWDSYEVESSEPKISPESRLWLAVLETAKDDIVTYRKRGIKGSKDLKRMKRWLYSRNFVHVCDFACVDPDYAKTIMLGHME